MSAGVFALVLLAALLHAGWNMVVKIGLSQQRAMFLLTAGHALIGAALVPFFPLPPAEVWPWLIASGLIHCAYQLFLAHAYEQGDLSRVYPIARGAAPVMVLAVSAALLADPMTGAEVSGVLILGGGIALMALGALRRGESRRLVPYALGAAAATAGYTLVDGLGARLWGQPLAHVSWLLILSALFYTPALVALRGRAVLRAGAREWGVGMGTAAASFAAYAIVVWAMTVAPIALVGALRETSIAFALLIGWLALGERMDAAKALATVLILAGAAVMRL